MLSTIPVTDLLAPHAISVIKREAAAQDRNVGDATLYVERDYVAVCIELDGSPILLCLGIRASSAIGDLAAFDVELRRSIRLIFDAHPH